jgi:hypothetical protein
MIFLKAIFKDLKPGILFLLDKRLCLFLKTTYLGEGGFRFKCLEMNGIGIEEYYMMKTEPIIIFKPVKKGVI